MDDIPEEARSDYHGQCCEPAMVSAALDAGVNPRGGTISTAAVGRPGNVRQERR